MIGVRALVALLTAVGLLVVANQFGPAAGGAVGAFPTSTFTLCSFLHAAGGPVAVIRVLAGMVRGLPPYFAFVLTYGVAGPYVGGIGATTAAALVCTCYYLHPALRPATRLGTTADARSVDEVARPPGEIEDRWAMRIKHPGTAGPHRDPAGLRDSSGVVRLGELTATR